MLLKVGETQELSMYFVIVFTLLSNPPNWNLNSSGIKSMFWLMNIERYLDNIKISIIVQIVNAMKNIDIKIEL